MYSMREKVPILSVGIDASHVKGAVAAMGCRNCGGPLSTGQIIPFVTEAVQVRAAIKSGPVCDLSVPSRIAASPKELANKEGF